MVKDRKTDRQKRGDLREEATAGRRVKAETVVVLVVAAFIVGFVVGALVALLKAPPLQEAGQVTSSDQGGLSSAGQMDSSREIERHEQLVQKDPANPDTWVGLGDVFYGNRQYGQAIEAYTKALDLGPRSAGVLIKLGNAYFDRESYEEAIAAYSKALTIDPKNADVLTDLGIAYRRTGMPEEALSAFRKAAQLDVRHAMSRYNQGVVLFHDLRNVVGAIKAWQEFLEIEPSGERAEKVRHMVETLKEMSSGE